MTYGVSKTKGFKILAQCKKNDKNKYPEAYDLVLLLLEDGREIPGWHVNQDNWDGIRFRKHMKVIGWKRQEFW